MLALFTKDTSKLISCSTNSMHPDGLPSEYINYEALGQSSSNVMEFRIHDDDPKVAGYFDPSKDLMNATPVLDSNGNIIDMNVPPKDISIVKSQKIRELENYRDWLIQQGFVSQTTGHAYYFSDKDQMKLQGKGVRIANDTTVTSVPWLTKDAGGVTHSRSQFLGVLDDADSFETEQHNKFYGYESQVNALTDPAQVNAFQWQPDAPIGLTGTAGTGQVTLNWSKNVEMVTGYNVYQGTTKLTSTPITTDTYTVTGLTSGTAQSFTVTAVGLNNVESPQSTAVSVTPS